MAGFGILSNHNFMGPEPEPCQHPNKQYTGALYDGPGGCKTWLYYTCPDCKVRFKEEEPEEPPLTPEEEEEAPPEEGCLGKFCDQEEPCRCRPPKMLGKEELDRRWAKAMGDDEPGCAREAGCQHPLTTDCENGCRWAADELSREANEMAPLPPPEGPEYTPCVCGHIVPEHTVTGGQICMIDGCECVAYRTKPDEGEAACPDCLAGEHGPNAHREEPPPQPGRRPPYAVAYSVQGHLYEVALPGDATVRAVDGALVIQHHLGPVAGIVSVLPVINEES